MDKTQVSTSNVSTSNVSTSNVSISNVSIINNIEHLVLSGGGFLGISYIGLLKYLEQHNSNSNSKGTGSTSLALSFVNNLKSITGCSAGSVFGVLIAIGYKSYEIEILFKTMVFAEYLTINADSLLNFMSTKGLDSGKKLITIIKLWIKNKTGNENITFSQLREKYNIDMQIGVTNLSKSAFEIMNYKTSPNLPIHIAISASIAIPFIFEPVIINNDVYCDGGVLDNLPIEHILYNMVNTQQDEKISEKPSETPKVNILCIYLMNDNKPTIKDNYKTISIQEYMASIIQAFSCEHVKHKSQIKSYQDKENIKKHKIIIYKIPCDIMTFIKLNASHEDIDNIINIAYDTTKKELE